MKQRQQKTEAATGDFYKKRCSKKIHKIHRKTHREDSDRDASL